MSSEYYETIDGAYFHSLILHKLPKSTRQHKMMSGLIVAVIEIE